MDSDTAAAPAMPVQLARYLADPQAWESIKVAILAHDQTCASLPHVWLARHGGVSSFAELGHCADCDVTFYWDGLPDSYGHSVNAVDEDGDPVSLCDCCARKRATT